MKQENWQKVKEVFYSALNRPEADWRAYLDDACSGDAAFRSDVELLLNSYESDYLEEPIWPSDEPVKRTRSGGRANSTASTFAF